MPITIYEIDDQGVFDAQCRASKAGALGQARQMRCRGRWWGHSGWTGRMYSYGRFMLVYGKSRHNIVKYPPIKIHK